MVGFRLLGEITATGEAGQAAVGHLRQRSVLASLLVDVGRVVSVDQLIDRVWGDHAPHRARETLHSYLSRLRKALAAAKVPAAVVARSPGYVLETDPDVVDLHRFHSLAEQARASADDHTANELFSQALSLWQGEAFENLETPWFHGRREAVNQHRVAVELDRAEVALRLGLHNDLIPELSGVAAVRPLDERLIGLLMLALYRCGRQAEALDYYEQTRQRLADELGTDPEPALRRLHRQMLGGHPELAPARTGTPVPRQLPPAPSLFVGRAEELAQLTKFLDGQADLSPSMVISVIGGAAGIGKTSLALRWAHEHLDQFGDGQLYVNLRGFDPSGEPLAPSAAVRGFLDALGADPSSISADPQAQVGLYRSLVSGRRMLVVLDNARDTTQVEPLLPGSPACTVLITSRHHLLGLGTSGARKLELDVIAEPEAHALLADHIGRERIVAEPEAARELLRWCGGLPLAIGIVAARAKTHPTFPLAVLADELRDTSSRLDALSGDELTVDVRAVFSWSLQAASEAAAAAFHAMGSAPGPDISVPAAAALLGHSTGRTRVLLRELEAISLVHQELPGRYRMHDLLRTYAAEQPGPLAAVIRLIDWYVHAAHTAMDLIHPNRRRIPLTARPSAAGLPAFSCADPAMTWFDNEFDNLVATIKVACGHHDTAVHAAELAQPLARYCLLRDRRTEWIDTHQAVLSALAHGTTAAPEVLAETHTNLATAYTVYNVLDTAIDYYTRALPLWRAAENRRGEANTLGNLGSTCVLRGDYLAASEHNHRAVAVSAEIGDLTGQANALTTLAIVSTRLENYEQAEEFALRSRELNRKIGDRYGEAINSEVLARIYRNAGRPDAAIRCAHEGLDLSRSLGDRRQETDIHSQLALVYAESGSLDEARNQLNRAMEILTDFGEPRSDSEALNDLGETLRLLGDHRGSMAKHETALAATDPYQQARARRGLARVHAELGQAELARENERAAVELFTRLGIDAGPADVR